MPTSLGLYDTLEAADQVPVAVTSDGGCRLKNPSPYGGMWAFRLTNAASEPLVQAYGIVLPSEVVPLSTVSNNLTETLALLIGLEFLPDNWSGKARTDSLNAIRVFRDRDKPRDWLPADILTRCRAVMDRLGAIEFELLAGHPSKAELARMRAGQVVVSERGYPYCLHNDWLDRILPTAWADYEAELERLGQ